VGTQQSPAESAGPTAKPGDDLKTALAVTKEDMAALSTEQRAMIAQRKNANIVAAQLAGLNWGKELDSATNRAVADWGQRHGVDVTTEIHVLGGNIYLNAQFYLNRLIDLVRAGQVLDFQQWFVQDDPRLAEALNEVVPATAGEAERLELEESKARIRKEIRFRREMRIKYSVPDTATAAVVTEVRLVKMPHVPFMGIKWAPHPNSRSADPVGKDYPQETALTRSARRALKQIVRHIPEVAKWLEGAEEDAIATVDKAIAENVERNQRKNLGTGEPRQLGAGAPGTFTPKAVPEPDYITSEDVVPPAKGKQAGGPVAVEAPGADPYADPTEGFKTLVIDRDLFGKVSVIEPTAEEKARAAAVAAGDDDDDMSDLSPDDRAAMERMNRRRD
jgi:hypothetical protein